MKYRKKPVVIEAEQWFGHGDIRVVALCPIALFGTIEDSWKCKHCGEDKDAHGWIETLEGGHIVCPYDWIIKGVKGEFYPCKPDIFEETYEKVE